MRRLLSQAWQWLIRQVLAIGQQVVVWVRTRLRERHFVRAWRWLASNDPFSLMAAWLIPHRALLGWASLVAFAGLLAYEPLRWNAIATLWGIVGAGLLVSVILQERGEPIQRRAWLRRNSDTVRFFLGEIRRASGHVVDTALGLEQRLKQPLLYGATMTETQMAIDETRALIAADSDGSHLRPLPTDFEAWAMYMEDVHDRIMAAVARNSGLIDRMTELQGAITRFNIAFSFLDFGVGLQMEGTTRVQLAGGALDICEQCCKLLYEGGIIE
ncbi:MAG: hypothetical protein M3082_08360 [Candidatus Dormibacteraeota bacterium]|nr:hypothetical protein [Candidatus Dormibacteraeota bacterium]